MPERSSQMIAEHAPGCKCGAHSAPHVLRTHAARKDPTRTTGLRIRFEQELNRRFTKLKRDIREAIVVRDVFGLQSPTVNTIKVAATGLPAPRAFAFPRSNDKVDGFMEWLRKAEDDTIFEIITGTPVRSASQNSWMNTYIRSAYQKGLSQAASQVRSAGGTVADSWLDSAFYRPIHADPLGLIYTRAYSELTGITDAMDQQISRVLAQGIAEGRGPQQIARDLNNKVDGIGRHRARLLARTEIVSAHSEASLNAYEEAGVEGVAVQAEWSTAGDDAVCAQCEAMQGRTFTMKAAHGLIPLHPNCRCAWLPVIGTPGKQGELGMQLALR